MSESERRMRNRCPVCQGPTKIGAGTEEEKCRNSICSFNHRQVVCPRCGESGPSTTEYDTSGKFHYFCVECQNKWVAQ